MADVETASEDYAQRFSGECGRYFMEVQTCIAINSLKSYPNASVLDVGGGHAQLAIPMMDAGFRVTVAGSADSCRNRLDRLLPSGGVAYQTCDLLNLPFKEQSFDIGIAFRLLPHVPEWKRQIAEVCRISRKAVLIDYPDIRSWNIMNRVLFRAKKAFEGNTRPFSMFSRKQILREFRGHEFNRVAMWPEYFLPMVIHRFIRSQMTSNVLETIPKITGMTRLFGSPVIVRAERVKKIESTHFRKNMN